MISFLIQNKHVLGRFIKKEPYGDRIPNTGFYPISCIEFLS